MGEQPDQLDMPVHDDETALFMTDEDLDQRLRQLENGLADIEARIPTMRREVTVIRRWLVRQEIRQAHGSAETNAIQGSDSSEAPRPASGDLPQHPSLPPSPRP